MLDLRDKLAERFGREAEFAIDYTALDYIRHNGYEMIKVRLVKAAQPADEVTISVDHRRRFEIYFTGKDALWMRRALEVFECVLSDWEVGQV